MIPQISKPSNHSIGDASQVAGVNAGVSVVVAVGEDASPTARPLRMPSVAAWAAFADLAFQFCNPHVARYDLRATDSVHYHYASAEAQREGEEQSRYHHQCHHCVHPLSFEIVRPIAPDFFIIQHVA